MNLGLTNVDKVSFYDLKNIYYETDLYKAANKQLHLQLILTISQLANIKTSIINHIIYFLLMRELILLFVLVCALTATTEQQHPRANASLYRSHKHYANFTEKRLT